MQSLVVFKWSFVVIVRPPIGPIGYLQLKMKCIEVCHYNVIYVTLYRPFLKFLLNLRNEINKIYHFSVYGTRTKGENQRWFCQLWEYLEYIYICSKSLYDTRDQKFIYLSRLAVSEPNREATVIWVECPHSGLANILKVDWK